MNLRLPSAAALAMAVAVSLPLAPVALAADSPAEPPKEKTGTEVKFNGGRFLPDQKAVELYGIRNRRTTLLEYFACSGGDKDHESLLRLESRPFDLHASLRFLGLRDGGLGEGPQGQGDEETPIGDKVEVRVRWNELFVEYAAKGKDGKEGAVSVSLQRLAVEKALEKKWPLDFEIRLTPEGEKDFDLGDYDGKKFPDLPWRKKATGKIAWKYLKKTGEDASQPHEEDLDDFLFGGSPPEGARLKAREQTFAAPELVIDRRKGAEMAADNPDWIFSGSETAMDAGPAEDEKADPPADLAPAEKKTPRSIYLADAEGLVIALYHDPGAVLDHSLPTGADQDAYAPNDKKLPAVGTKVTILISPAAKK